ncbi:thiamine phosphate synthase [uncultured Hyphomicrobium sp.]|uniref:thiamine phosphate synthase n=1 Tax=uncultured Hyphomicrobium sp. TaxID=194373 RepID=UPI0025FB7CD6|nr:thiamine phosphate synthase [uncultured Hyphomicrobium sp.]
MSRAQPTPGLCLVASAESGADGATRIASALEATGAITLILTPPASGAFDPAATRALIEAAHARKVAVLLANDVPAAQRLDADGVHLSWRPEIEDAYEAARGTLGPDAIVGADAGDSRHDAMTLGEAGADYVAFSLLPDADDPAEARATQRDLLSWWVEVFVVPAVAFDAGTPADARELARTGADFVAVRLPADVPAEKMASWAQPFIAALGAPADAA